MLRNPVSSGVVRASGLAIRSSSQAAGTRCDCSWGGAALRLRPSGLLTDPVLDTFACRMRFGMAQGDLRLGHLFFCWSHYPQCRGCGIYRTLTFTRFEGRLWQLQSVSPFVMRLSFPICSTSPIRAARDSPESVVVCRVLYTSLHGWSIILDRCEIACLAFEILHAGTSPARPN